MADTPLGASPELADQALANLVNQFARPLDFLRELVQNAIDAGTPRIEVWIRRGPEVLEIHVDDFGDGMDEAIIDNQLTRLFSSTKEDDLTKIGKFGIGFTSIFAIAPDAVLLHTGRHGESWELLFHPDRSYEKVRLDTPVDGTKITLFKRMDPDDMPGFVREARWVLGYWCEHSTIPITFEDRTDATAGPATAPDDVFAAFEAPESAARGEVVNSPFALESPLEVDVTIDDVRVLLGVSEEPGYGFYNGGLTLVSTRNPEVLGPHGERLGHLALKIRCDALEHTLTRDNVLRDAHWAAALDAAEAAAVKLRTLLLDRVQQALADGDDDADTWLDRLARECRGSQLHEDLDAFPALPLFPDLDGGLHSLEGVRDQAEDLDAVLFASHRDGLDRALIREGLLVLPFRPGLRALVRETAGRTGFGPFQRDLVPTPATTLFVLPDLVPPDQLTETEDRLLSTLRGLFKAAVGRRVHLALGDFGGPEAGRHEDLFVEGPKDGRVFQRQDAALRLPGPLRRRCMILNRHHPDLQLQLAASVDDLVLAAFALAQLLLTQEDAEPERTYVKLTAAALDAATAQVRGS